MRTPPATATCGFLRAGYRARTACDYGSRATHDLRERGKVMNLNRRELLDIALALEFNTIGNHGDKYDERRKELLAKIIEAKNKLPRGDDE